MNRAGASAAGPSITRNTIWNFAGIAAPVPVALLAIPALIARLGQERFGLLTIAWALMGYFGVFDFGLSRATTNYLARACHDGDDAHARQLFWSAAAAHLVLGLIGGLILFLAAPVLERMLSVEPALRGETRMALYLLALSVPIVVLTAMTRGVLEALHRFDLVNAVKVPASMITYLGPLAALAFTQRLPPVIAVILACRAAVLLTYLIMGFRVLPAVRTFESPRMATLGPLVAMGGWITVGTVLTPMLVSIDRFVIGSAVSVAAVAAYAAPYEVVTKLWMFSGSLMGVLFPRFSILVADREALRRLYRHALVSLTLCTTPVAGLMVAFAPEFFQAWLGPEIAREGVAVARWLTAGVLVNVIAQVPFTALQATGHADATGKLQMIELPLYAVATWFAAAQWGVIGVAIAWASRATVDALLLFVAATCRLGPIHGRGAPTTAALVACASAVFMVWCWQAVPLVAPALIPRALVVCLSIGAFTYLVSRSLNVSLRRAALLLRADA
jgi:O-antigen/teichoic acid export membrane protein